MAKRLKAIEGDGASKETNWEVHIFGNGKLESVVVLGCILGVQMCWKKFLWGCDMYAIRNLGIPSKIHQNCVKQIRLIFVLQSKGVLWNP